MDESTLAYRCGGSTGFVYKTHLFPSFTSIAKIHEFGT